MNSWYNSEKVINACNRKVFHVIAAVKTNRLISVSGVTISMDDFAAQYIRKSDLRSVTVESQGTYWIYEYEDPVSEIENVKTLLSWKRGVCPFETSGLSSLHGFKLGAGHHSTLLSRAMEYRNRLSLFKRIAWH